MSVLYDHCTKRVREKNAVRLDGSESTVPRGAQSPASWRHTARIPPAEGPVSDQLSATGVASSRPYSRIAEYSWFRRKEGPFAIKARNHGGWHSFQAFSRKYSCRRGSTTAQDPRDCLRHSNLNAANPYLQSPFEDQGARAREESRRKSAHQIVVRYSSVTYSPHGSLPAFRCCQRQCSGHNFGN
jgi:hypothetical protein